MKGELSRIVDKTVKIEEETFEKKTQTNCRCHQFKKIMPLKCKKGHLRIYMTRLEKEEPKRLKKSVQMLVKMLISGKS